MLPLIVIPRTHDYCLRPADSFDVSVLLLLALAGDVELNPGLSWDSSKSRCDDASQRETWSARGENLIASDQPSLLSPSSGITIVHFNIRSLLEHFDQLTEFVHDHSPDIVAISETWLNDSVDASVLAMPGYNVYRADRHRHGGGVAIFAAANLVCKAVPIDSGLPSSAESVWLEVSASSISSTTLVGCIYRTPSANTTSMNNICDLID